MATSFVRVFMVILAINIALYVGGVRVISDDNSFYMDQFIDNDLFQNNSQLVISDNLTGVVPNDFSQSGAVGSSLGFIDALKSVVSFIKFLFNILFASIGLFTSASLPPVLNLLIALPLTLAQIFGFIYFIRSGN